MISENAIGDLREVGPMASCGFVGEPITLLVTFAMSRNCAMAGTLVLRLLTQNPK